MQLDSSRIKQELYFQGMNQNMFGKLVRERCAKSGLKVISQDWINKILNGRHAAAPLVKVMADVLSLDIRDLVLPEKQNGRRRAS